MTNKRKTKKQLRNGCSRTEVFISPKNYKTLKNKSDLTKDWFVECRFYDPLFKDKGGIKIKSWGLGKKFG